MMELDILRADPAGNITVFVFDEIDKADRARVANAIMENKALAAEQVAFVVKPLSPASDGRFEMMGGEFCGNATRAFALFLATQRNAGRQELTLEVSGCAAPIKALADPDNHTASAQMPLPSIGGELILAGFDCVRVDLDGISHLVADCIEPNSRLLNAAAALFEPEEQTAAYGVIFSDRERMSLIPAVTVKATKSLVWEGSCGSGSVAAAAAFAFGRPDGEYSFSLSQPSGVITAEVKKQGGAFTFASIGGSVILGQRERLRI